MQLPEGTGEWEPFLATQPTTMQLHETLKKQLLPCFCRVFKKKSEVLVKDTDACHGYGLSWVLDPPSLNFCVSPRWSLHGASQAGRGLQGKVLVAEAATTAGWREEVGPGPSATANLRQQRGARGSAPSLGSLVEPIRSYATRVMHGARREMSMKSGCKVRQS